MDTNIFHELADDMLENIFGSIDAVAEDFNMEADLLNGVLSIKLPDDNGEYVLNKHEVTKQIWLSSPFSGAFRFRFDENKDLWVNENDDEIIEFLNSELSNMGNLNIEI